MTSHHPSELDSTAGDSVTSSPRSDLPPTDLQQRVRFMCSFGGKILPRPHDNMLRYVGGDTRIVAVNRHTTFPALLNKLSKLSGTTNITVKYQLPSEDLDSLISVTTDEDVENMMEEFDRLVHTLGFKTARLRLFLFLIGGDESRNSSISSILDGSTRRESWFLDALNGGSGSGGLERGRSEASSIVSEVPDYLFGLDNADDSHPREAKVKSRTALAENISGSDPSSPAPVISSSPFCSTSSALGVPAMPDLPPVKTKPNNPIQTGASRENRVETYVENGDPQITQPTATGYAGSNSPMWHYNYIPESHYSGQNVQPMQVYYVPGPVPPSNVPVQPVAIRAQYVQQFSAQPGQVPIGFPHQVPGMGQVYGGVMRPVAATDPYDGGARVVPDGLNQQQVYYGVKTGGGGVVPAYQGMVVPGGGGEDMHGAGPDTRSGRVGQ